MAKRKKTKKAEKLAKRKKEEKDRKRMLTRPINVPAPLDAPETRWAVPLIATENNTQRRHAEGTAFFIAPDILLTAWHNIPALIAKIGGNSDIERDSYNWSESQVLDFMTISVIQAIEGGYGMQRSVRHIHRSTASNDIAILHLWPDENVPTDVPIEYAGLDANPPALGERMRAFGYTASIAHDGLDDNGLLILGHDPRIAAGIVEDIYEPRRDSVTLPFPCYSVKANFMGGMSGGPVNNQRGRICGIISRGMDLEDSNNPISYAASIWPILGELIQWDGFNGGEPFTIMDLASTIIPSKGKAYINIDNFRNYALVQDYETNKIVQVVRKEVPSDDLYCISIKEAVHEI